MSSVMQDEPDGPDSEYGLESRRNCNDEKDNSRPASMSTEGADDRNESHCGEHRSTYNRGASFRHDQHDC